MVSQAVVTKDDVLVKINEYISDGQSFLLQGGAGSGKTYLLVQTLDSIFQHTPKASVACITFTKVAVNEIKERCNYDRLAISTIHNFIWDAIKDYQNDLKSSLAELVANEATEKGTGITYAGSKALTKEYYKDIPIHYEEWLNIEDGAISHDEVLKIANYMFKKYPLLGKILADKFNYVVVDEYQDTEAQIIEILLKCIPNNAFIAFFGDSMQSIYDKGVGSLDTYLTEYSIKKLTREGNRRCSVNVIGLINKVRNDGLQQVPGADNAEGSVTFLYSDNPDLTVEEIRTDIAFSDWDFKDSKNTKELYLTHNLISRHAKYDNLFQIYDKDQIIAHVRNIKAEIKKDPTLAVSVLEKSFGEVLDLNIKRTSKPFEQFVSDNAVLFEWAKNLSFEKLSRMYVNNDQLVEGGSEKKENRGDKKDSLIKYLTKIQECLYLYDAGRVHEFTSLTDFRINNVADKARLQSIMEKFRGLDNSSIGDLIELADKEGIVKKDDKLKDFIVASEYLYERVKKVYYKEFVNLFDTEQGHNPFSTQHSVKGAEYDNVFIVLDNGNWNQYNFKYLFEGSGTESVIERSRKMFYVCCSRSKQNLVVYFPQPTESTIARAVEWFGRENVRKI